MSAPIVIVGAGQGGISCAAKLRNLGYCGDIVIVGDEPVPPYQRPPLSKKYMSGELELERLFIRPRSWFDEQQIELRLSTAVESIDPAGHSIEFVGGGKLAYSCLLLATGSRPRRFPVEIGGDLAGTFTIRNLADADTLAPALVPGRRLLVIGGGYIGLEAAAVAASKGLDVTIVEVASRILQRVAAAPVSDYFRDLHRRHGVKILESAALAEFTSSGGRVTGARLKDGSILGADLVIVGIGILPNDDLAQAAGIAIEDGIVVDGQCRTSAPDIFAAGDCANFLLHGQHTRLESVQNAIEHAEHAAGAMLGSDASYEPSPWFWSDQYDVKLQIAGLNRGYDDIVLRPGKRPQSQSVWYYRETTLIAIDCVNDALAYTVGKKLIKAGRSVTKAAAADPSTDLKALLE